MDETVARILDPGYLDDLESRPIEEIRAMRAECQEIETGLSFLRRVVQGRLDIVQAELARRREGGDPRDLSALIDKLPAILAEHLRAPGTGRLPTTLGSGKVDEELSRRLDEIVAATGFDNLADATDDQLARASEGLAELEADVSSRRRAMFDRIDALQAELTRRYRTGEATVESLLR